MKLQSSLDVLLLCNGESLMKSIVCSQLRWKNFLCHLCMLSILILCILQFKTNKKNVNDTRLPRCFSCLLVAVSHSLWYIYIYISNLDIWCLIDVFAFLQWPRWEQAGVHQRHPALPVWGGHAFSPGKRSLGPPRFCQNTCTCFPKAAILIYRLKL